MESQTTIFFLRHGDTNFRYLPVSFIDKYRRLNNLGKERIAKVGEYLSDFSPDLIITSPMIRCQQTAEIVRLKTNYQDKVRITRQLKEVYSFKDYFSIQTNVVDLVKVLVQENPGKKIVLVSHGLIIRRATELLGANDDELTSTFKTGEMYQIIFAGDKFISCQKKSPGYEI